MSKIIDEIELQANEEKAVNTKKAKDLIKLTMLQEQISQKIKHIYEELDEEDKYNSSQVIKQRFNIPDYVTVKDAAEIIGVTVQMIRKYCVENKLTAQQTMPGSGKWRIETTQLMNYPGWNNYLEKRSSIKNQSLNLARFMNDNIKNL